MSERMEPKQQGDHLAVTSSGEHTEGAVVESSRFSLRGSMFGVDLNERGDRDPHIVLTVLTEDDENWHPKMQFSSFWLDDMIEVLKRAKRECRRLGVPDRDGFGFEFKRTTTAAKAK